MGFGPISVRIAVVGTGVIGASWAAYFLAKLAQPIAFSQQVRNTKRKRDDRH